MVYPDPAELSDSDPGLEKTPAKPVPSELPFRNVSLAYHAKSSEHLSPLTVAYCRKFFLK